MGEIRERCDTSHSTALQALALLNDRLMVTMAGHLAGRREREAVDLPGRVDRAFLL